jgi:sigma-E factor negative regulatory protein RseA
MISTMSQVKREQLSILMDDELGRSEVHGALADLTSDQELRSLWDRYHLIGDALRGEPLNRAVTQIAERVRARLATEGVVPLPARRRLVPRQWVSPLFGSALAASLAVVAIIAGPALFRGDGAAPLQVAVTPTARPAAVPPTAFYVNRTGTYWNLQRPEVESKLNSYLVNHQEYAPATGMKGMLPYATFVSYDARR